MAELADAQASGACGRKIVWVQVPFPALFFILSKIKKELLLPDEYLPRGSSSFYFSHFSSKNPEKKVKPGFSPTFAMM